MKSIREIVGASSKDLKDSRVSSALKNMASVSEQKIQSKIVDFRDKRMKFDSLLDLGDDTTMDIASKIRKINPSEFTENINKAVEELVILARSISIDVAIHNQLFSDKQIDGLDADDIDGFVDAIYPVRPE